MVLCKSLCKSLPVRPVLDSCLRWAMSGANPLAGLDFRLIRRDGLS